MIEGISKFAITVEHEMDSSCDIVWNNIMDIAKYPETFGSVYHAEILNDKGADTKKRRTNKKKEIRAQAGTKCRLVRLLKSGECISADWTVTHKSEETDAFPRKVMYSTSNLGGEHVATATSTWFVTPLKKGCKVTITLAVIPRKAVVVVGESIIFYWMLKKLCKSYCKQDLVDLDIASKKVSHVQELKNANVQNTLLIDASSGSLNNIEKQPKADPGSSSSPKPSAVSIIKQQQQLETERSSSSSLDQVGYTNNSIKNSSSDNNNNAPCGYHRQSSNNNQTNLLLQSVKNTISKERMLYYYNNKPAWYSNKTNTTRNSKIMRAT